MSLVISPFTGRVFSRQVPARITASAAAPLVSGPRTPDPGLKSAAPLYTVVRPSARDRWLGATARSYDPSRVESVLRGAMSGNLSDQWALFDLMEDTAPRIKKNLNRLKRAVKNLERKFEPYAEDDEPATESAIKRAKVASSALWGMRPVSTDNQNGFCDTIYDVLDAWAKGIAVLEINWHVRDAGKLGKIVAPQSTHFIHPRFYGYGSQSDWLGLNTAEIQSAKAMAVGPIDSGLRTPDSGLGTLDSGLRATDGTFARFPENKFLVCVCKTKSGHPAGGALLRSLAFWWAAANFTQEWFLNLAQIFGMPIRWANYDANIPGLVDKVLEMLENMGSAGYAAFPSGTTLELKEPMKAGTDNPQVALLDRFERACDYLILGQSGTTDISGPGKTGGSNAANMVLQDVETEIIMSAADFVESVFNEQMLPMINRLNFSDDTECPELCLEPEMVDDVTGLVTNYKIAVEAQAITPNADDEKHLRQKLSLPAMNSQVEADWASNNGVRAKPVPVSPFNPSAPQFATAHAHASTGDATDKLIDNVLEDLTGVEAKWLGALKPTFHRLIALAQSGEVSDEEFVRALAKAQADMPELFHKMDKAALADALNNAMSTALVNGVVSASNDRRMAAHARAAAAPSRSEEVLQEIHHTLQDLAHAGANPPEQNINISIKPPEVRKKYAQFDRDENGRITGATVIEEPTA